MDPLIHAIVDLFVLICALYAFLNFQPIFKVTVQSEGISQLSTSEYKTLKETFNGNLVMYTVVLWIIKS